MTMWVNGPRSPRWGALITTLSQSGVTRNPSRLAASANLSSLYFYPYIFYILFSSHGKIYTALKIRSESAVSCVSTRAYSEFLVTRRLAFCVKGEFIG